MNRKRRFSPYFIEEILLSRVTFYALLILIVAIGLWLLGISLGTIAFR